MKNLFKILFAGIVSLMIIACAREDEKAVFNQTGNPSLKSDAATIVLIKENATNHAITFNWTAPTYNPNLAPNNELQISIKGTNFANPKVVVLDNAVHSVSYTVQEFNTLMLSMGVPFTATDIEARVVSKFPASQTISPIYSSTLNLKVTPYALISYLYAPGNYQGWNPTTANTLVSATSNGIYIGYINFEAAGSEFKITDGRDWAINYGSNDGVNLVSNGGNIASPGAGYYKITVNMNTKKIAMVPYSMGVVGSGAPNGWNGPDLKMNWDDANLAWTVTSTFTAGEIKFRVNNDWAENYGGANGIADGNNGPNIAITAGSHKVTFKPFSMTYAIQ